jgi:hypothetical protein
MPILTKNSSSLIKYTLHAVATLFRQCSITIIHNTTLHLYLFFFVALTHDTLLIFIVTRLQYVTFVCACPAIALLYF